MLTSRMHKRAIILAEQSASSVLEANALAEHLFLFHSSVAGSFHSLSPSLPLSLSHTHSHSHSLTLSLSLTHTHIDASSFVQRHKPGRQQMVAETFQAAERPTPSRIRHVDRPASTHSPHYCHLLLAMYRARGWHTTTASNTGIVSSFQALCSRACSRPQ